MTVARGWTAWHGPRDSLAAIASQPGAAARSDDAIQPGVGICLGFFVAKPAVGGRTSPPSPPPGEHSHTNDRKQRNDH
jgi:hypothetical protein